MVIYSWLIHWKWWFSIVMLVYQRYLWKSNVAMGNTWSGWWFQPSPLKDDGVRQLGLWNSKLNGNIKFMFQTTNQLWMKIYSWENHQTIGNFPASHVWLLDETNSSQRRSVLPRMWIALRVHTLYNVNPRFTNPGCLIRDKYLLLRWHSSMNKNSGVDQTSREHRRGHLQDDRANPKPMLRTIIMLKTIMSFW